MSVLDRDSLEASPLADLHAIATELGLDGFRRLRKADLVDAILGHQGGEPAVEADDEPDEKRSRDDDGGDGDGQADDGERPSRSRPRRRGGRGRGRAGTAGGGRGGAGGGGGAAAGGGGGGRGSARQRDDAPGDDELADAEEGSVEGVVELLGNGSGFVRVNPPDPSDDDVYISAAQVRRCELVSGDKVSGPVRRPRRSERYPSLVRVEEINGAPADEIAEGARYDELPASFATERFALGSDDETLKAIEWLTPFGKGSRVALVGGPRSGKTEALRRIAGALAATEGLTISLVLAGARPEEVFEWSSGSVHPAAIASLGSSADSQSQAVEHAVEQARRIAARGGDAVVLIDNLDGLHAAAAQRALAAARNIADGGSLTVIATAERPLGGETTVIAFDAGLAGTRRFPAIHLATSGTLRPELLVGEAGAEAIARARAEALG